MKLVVRQIAKFVLVGGLNTAVDLGILNVLIWSTDVASGFLFSVFKGISFTAAVINSYFWNKLWTFRKKETAEVKKEFAQFFGASLVGFAVNVGVATLVVNVIGAQFGLGPKLWANVGAICATLVGMSWNFVSYKFFVFKK